MLNEMYAMIILEYGEVNEIPTEEIEILMERFNESKEVVIENLELVSYGLMNPNEVYYQ